MCCWKFPLPCSPLGSPTKLARPKRYLRQCKRILELHRKRCRRKEVRIEKWWMIMHEMQEKRWGVVNTAAVWVHKSETQAEEKGAVKKKYKKGKEERKGVKPTGIVWLIQLSSKSLRQPRLQTTRTEFLSAHSATAIWRLYKSRRQRAQHSKEPLF